MSLRTRLKETNKLGDTTSTEVDNAAAKALQAQKEYTEAFRKGRIAGLNYMGKKYPDGTMDADIEAFERVDQQDTVRPKK